MSFFCGRYQNLCFPEEKEPRWTLKTLQSFSLSWVSRWIFLKGHSSDHSTLKVILPQIEWVLTSDFYSVHIFIIFSKRWKNTWTLEGPKRSGFWSTLLRGLNTKMPTWSSCFTSSTLQIMSDQATSEVFQNKIFISGDSLYTFPRHSPRPVRRKRRKKFSWTFQRRVVAADCLELEVEVDILRFKKFKRFKKFEQDKNIPQHLLPFPHLTSKDNWCPSLPILQFF